MLEYAFAVFIIQPDLTDQTPWRITLAFSHGFMYREFITWDAARDWYLPKLYNPRDERYKSKLVWALESDFESRHLQREQHYGRISQNIFES